VRRILWLLVIALGAAAAYVWSQPGDFRIERSALIAAPPAVVFRNLEDFHRWGAWSPWEKLDPRMERTFEGPATGVGSSYAWRGNSKAGAGRMTVTLDRPPERLDIRLEFTAPMEATNQVEFDVSPHVADLTEVRWSMQGTRNFVQKAFALVVDVDAMVGGDFDRGLEALKSVCEAEAAADEAKRAAEATAPPTPAAEVPAPPAP
jgi:hypothetical protein